MSHETFRGWCEHRATWGLRETRVTFSSQRLGHLPASTQLTGRAETKGEAGDGGLRRPRADTAVPCELLDERPRLYTIAPKLRKMSGHPWQATNNERFLIQKGVLGPRGVTGCWPYLKDSER